MSLRTLKRRRLREKAREKQEEALVDLEQQLFPTPALDHPHLYTYLAYCGLDVSERAEPVLVQAAMLLWDELKTVLVDDLIALVFHYILDRCKGTTHIRTISTAQFQILPKGLAANGDQLFVCDSERCCILNFEISTGNYLGFFGSPGSFDYQFDYPECIYYDQDELFISDVENRRIQVFSREGGFKRNFSVPYRPVGVVVWDDRCYVASYEGHLVYYYTRLGEELGCIDGDFNNPNGLACDGNFLYVSDWGNDRIQLFDKEGSCWKQISASLYFEKPIRVAVSGDYVYIADAECKVKVFHQSGQYIKTIGVKGQFGEIPIYGLLVHGEKLYVSDGWNRCVHVFS